MQQGVAQGRWSVIQTAYAQHVTFDTRMEAVFGSVQSQGSRWHQLRTVMLAVRHVWRVAGPMALMHAFGAYMHPDQR